MALERQRSGGTYVMNHRSFGEMMLSEQLRRRLVQVSREVAKQARRNTMAATGQDGKLERGYHVEPGPIVIVKGQTGIPGPRISHRVVNSVRYAAVSEFGIGRPRASTKGSSLRGNALRRVKNADVYGPNSGRHGTRALRRAGELYNDGIEGAA